MSRTFREVQLQYLMIFHNSGLPPLGYIPAGATQSSIERPVRFSPCGLAHGGWCRRGSGALLYCFILYCIMLSHVVPTVVFLSGVPGVSDTQGRCSDTHKFLKPYEWVSELTPSYLFLHKCLFRANFSFAFSKH